MKTTEIFSTLGITPVQSSDIEIKATPKGKGKKAGEHSPEVKVNTYALSQSEASRLIDLATSEGFKLESLQPLAGGPFGTENAGKVKRILQKILDFINIALSIVKKKLHIVMWLEHIECDKMYIVSYKDLHKASKEQVSSRGIFGKPSPAKKAADLDEVAIVLTRPKTI